MVNVPKHVIFTIVHVHKHGIIMVNVPKNVVAPL